MPDLNDMPPCTHCYSTGHGVNACPDKDEGSGVTRTRLMSDDAEPDMSSVQRFRDSLPPRSEDMMPSHPAESAGDMAMVAAGCFDPREGGRDAPPSDYEDVTAFMERHRQLQNFTKNREWLQTKLQLEEAEGRALSCHVMDPNGQGEMEWGGLCNKLEEKLKGIEAELL